MLHVTAAGYETDQLQDLIRCELIGVTQRVFTPRSQDVSCNILIVQPRREASRGVHASCLSRTLKYKKVCEVMVEVFYSITSSTQILKASPQNKQNTSPSNHNRSTIWQVMKSACNSGNFFFKGLNPLNQIKQLQQQYWWLHNGILGQRHAVVNRLVPTEMTCLVKLWNKMNRQLFSGIMSKTFSSFSFLNVKISGSSSSVMIVNWIRCQMHLHLIITVVLYYILFWLSSKRIKKIK